MKTRKSIFFFLLISFNAWTQNPIAPGRIADWDGHVGVPGAIPVRTAIYTTINVAVYGNGTTDASAAISSAIASCPAGQVVYLPAGTYLLNNPVDFNLKSNVTLRGDGAGKTFLDPHGFAALYTGEANMSAERQVLSGSTKGSTSITVNDVTGIQPGLILDLYEANDTDFFWSRAGHVDFTGQWVTVKSVSGTTILLEDPLVFDFTLNPRFRYYTAKGCSWIGIEDMTIKGDQNYTGSMIKFFGAYASWIRNVETAWGNGNEHIFMYGSVRCEVRDCYIHDTYSTSDGYGIMTGLSSDIIYGHGGCTGLLIENNIFANLLVSVMFETETGSVVGYNYSRNARLQMWPNYVVPDFIVNHAPHGIMDLFEGNIACGLQSDGYHGSISHLTLFRNWFSGKHVDPNRTGNIKLVDLDRYSRYSNVVGNVLGFTGWTGSACVGQYEMTGQPGYTAQADIYRLGYPNMGNNGYDFNNPPSNADYGGLDPKTKSTLMRWGNFDFQNNSSQWSASEVPSGIVRFANPVPVNQSLPVSLYHSNKPVWFCALPWPLIGPDVTGGDADPSGYVFKNPAQKCYESTAKDINGNLILFSANTCYCNSVTGIQSDSDPVRSLAIYPNPFNSYATIFSEMKDCSVTIFDVTGNVVKNFLNVKQFPFSIERGGLSSGIYILELHSENNAEIMKLVIE